MKCKRCNGQGELRVAVHTQFGTVVDYVACDMCNGTGESIPRDNYHSADPWYNLYYDLSRQQKS